MFKIVIRINTRCLKHPRYNPVKQGPTFRSGCAECQRVWSVYQKAMELRRLLGANEEEKDNSK